MFQRPMRGEDAARLVGAGWKMQRGRKGLRLWMSPDERLLPERVALEELAGTARPPASYLRAIRSGMQKRYRKAVRPETAEAKEKTA